MHPGHGHATPGPTRRQHWLEGRATFTTALRIARRLVPVTALLAALIAGGSGLPAFSRDLPGSVPGATLPGGQPTRAPGLPASPSVVGPPPPPVEASPSPGRPSIVPGSIAFHVEASGDDAAPGTAARPWHTLGHAVATVPDGATIRLGAGVFAATSIRRPGITVVGTGEATVISGGLTIFADSVTISRVTITGQEAAYRGGVTVEGARDVTISDSVVRGNPFGIHLVDARLARVEHNRITDNGYGVEIHGATDGTVVADNEIVDNDRRLDASRAAGGVNLYFTTGGITLADNTIRDNDQVAIEIFGASDVGIVGNRLSGSNDLIETGTQDGHACQNLLVSGNVMFSQHPSDGNEVRGVYLRCASNATLEWNTFVGLDRFAIGLIAGSGGFNGPVEAVSVRHNIIAGGRAFSIDSQLPDGITIDSDVIFPCRADPCPVLGREVAFVASWRSGTDRWGTFRAWTGLESRGRFADPEFVDAAGGDFRIQPGSPASGFAGAFDAPVVR